MLTGQQVVVSGVAILQVIYTVLFLALYVIMKDAELHLLLFLYAADLHSRRKISMNTKELKENVLHVASEYMACGLDPDKVVLYCQSDLPQTTELYLFLNMMAYKGELEKTTTFKDKVRLQPENVNAGLLTYPVLMAADIMIHRAKLVPVGKDQEQHLEMTRTFANRFNHRYGDVFPNPGLLILASNC
ncbi:tryptophan--tRNA ligase [Niabella hibiscisoli]|uniref:tryptophan--tRNA ligase n=1 Tax=Niabella hibiscisoli TaxID=1825928 RepID=UPI0021D4854F|nr:hypothetical protein [Niabella hibiscisoli]